MNGNDNGFIKNRNKEKQRQNNVREYQRKFLNKKMKRGINYGRCNGFSHTKMVKRKIW